MLTVTVASVPLRVKVSMDNMGEQLGSQEELVDRTSSEQTCKILIVNCNYMCIGYSVE